MTEEKKNEKISPYDWEAFGFKIYDSDQESFFITSKSPIMQEVLKLIDANIDGDLDVEEFERVRGDQYVNAHLSKMICCHRSEWSYRGDSLVKLKNDASAIYDEIIDKASPETQEQKQKYLQLKDESIKRFEQKAKNLSFMCEFPEFKTQQLPEFCFYYFHPFAFVEQMKRMNSELWNGKGYLAKKSGEIYKGQIDQNKCEFYFEDKNGNTIHVCTLSVTKSASGYDSVKFEDNAVPSIVNRTISSGNKYLCSDCAAALIAASYAFYEETSYKFYMNQYCSKDGYHSGSPREGTNADVRYAHNNGNVDGQVHTKHSHYSKKLSQKMVEYLRKYGYNTATSILTENASRNGKELENTYFVDGVYDKNGKKRVRQFEHYSHMHIQNYNKSHIKINKQ